MGGLSEGVTREMCVWQHWIYYDMVARDEWMRSTDGMRIVRQT
jgi:hypothetical protein